MCGSAYLTGTPDQPMRAAVPWVDCGTASLAAFGTLAALMARQKTGRGQKVEGALLRTAVAFNNSDARRAAGHRRSTASPTVNRGQTSAPSDIFRTKDGWIIAYAIGNPMFERWAKLIGEDALAHRSALQGRRARGDHGEIISKHDVASGRAARTTVEALAALEIGEDPRGPALLAAAGARGRPYPRRRPPDRHRVSRAAAAGAAGADPRRSVRDPGRFRHRAPTLDEHTDAILGELGYDGAAIAELRARGVI